MAGDGGRGPDVSEQRANSHEAGVEMATQVIFGPPTSASARQLVGESIAAYLECVDPVSVLAALLAESPEATVAAIEALLTNDEAMDAGLDGTHGYGAPITSSEIRAALRSACRSLLSRAPKEDGDA